MLLLPGSRIFDVAVVSEVWGIDRTDTGVPEFQLRICGSEAGAEPLMPAGKLEPTHRLTALRDCDLIVVPGRADPHADVPPAVVRTLRAAHQARTQIAALCSGAFVLAAAGLLDDRQATTHWRLLDQLAAAAPRTDVRSDVLFVDADDVLTSAGVAGGVDLCLHLVRRAHGVGVAAAIARRMVTPPARDGGQRQYVDEPVTVRPDKVPLAATLDWAQSHLDRPIGVSELAAHAGLSVRTLHRTFLAATGETPGRWLQTQRVRRAQQLLETSDLTMHRVAERSGLGTATNLRKRLRSHLGVSPDIYRRTFGSRPHPLRPLPAGGERPPLRSPVAGDF
jgi:transcriptional regulator GlxA family with amidase domain